MGRKGRGKGRVGEGKVEKCREGEGDGFRHGCWGMDAPASVLFLITNRAEERVEYVVALDAHTWEKGLKHTFSKSTVSIHYITL